MYSPRKLLEIRRITDNILTILIFIFALIASPLFILFFTCIFLYRFAVSKIVLIFKKDLNRILPLRSSFVLIEDLEKSMNYCVGFSCLLKGKMDKKLLTQFINEEMIEIRNPKTGKKCYPEMTSKLVKCIGFYFWSRDENFNVENHIIEFKPKIIKEFYGIVDLVEIQKTRMLTSLELNRPPWDGMFLNNFKFEGSDEVFSLFLWRSHHVVADGFSWAKFFFNFDPGNKAKYSFIKDNERRSTFSKFAPFLRFIFCSIYEGVYEVVSSFDFNELHPSLIRKRGDKIVKSVTHPQERILVKDLKEISLSNNVGVSTVIMAGVLGGIRKFMLEEGMKIPTKMHFGFPLPFPGHPDFKLRNHLTFGGLSLPIGMTDSLARLRKIERRIERLKNSSIPLLNFLITIPFLSTLPILNRFINKNFYSTAVLSSFPWFKEEICYAHTPADNFFFDLPFFPGNNPINITTMSYNGKLTIILTGDEQVFKTDAKMKKINEYIQDEIKILSSYNV